MFSLLFFGPTAVPYHIGVLHYQISILIYFVAFLPILFPVCHFAVCEHNLSFFVNLLERAQLFVFFPSFPNYLQKVFKIISIKCYFSPLILNLCITVLNIADTTYSHFLNISILHYKHPPKIPQTSYTSTQGHNKLPYGPCSWTLITSVYSLHLLLSQQATAHTNSLNKLLS